MRPQRAPGSLSAIPAGSANGHFMSFWDSVFRKRVYKTVMVSLAEKI